MIRLALWLWVCGSCFLVSGQEPHFNMHTLGDGLVNLKVHTLLQDRDGMIWLGTTHGLAAYDGLKLHFQEVDSGFAQEPVMAVFEDSRSRLWVGMKNGGVYYLDSLRRYQAFTPDEGHPAQSVIGFAEDAQGQIWMATYGEGVYIISGQRVFNINADDGLSGNDIYDIALDANGDTWLATDNGISICRFVNEQKQIRTIGLEDGLPDQVVTRLLPTPDGEMWIGTFDSGVVRYDGTTGQINRIFPQEGYDEITSLAVYDSLEIWIGTRSGGLWRYRHNWKLPIRVESLYRSFPGAVGPLMSDAEGNIWAVLEGDRLVSALRPFELLTGPVPDIQTLMCDRQDRLWVGTRSGLYRIDRQPMAPSVFQRVAKDYDFNITDLVEDRHGNLWIGTIDQGLFIYHPGSGRVVHIGSVLGDGGQSVMSMAHSAGRIWVATLQGVLYYPASLNILEEGTDAFALLDDPWESYLHFVFHIFIDKRGRAWFATDGNGVFLIDGDEVRQIKGDSATVLRTVYSICEDFRGHMWFSSPDHGLVEFDGRDFRPLGPADGLVGQQHASLTATRTGDLLLVHDSGLDLLEPYRRHFMYYDDEIGVRDLEPGLNSIAVDGKGTVYAGGRQQIVAYTPRYARTSIHPRTRITSVHVFGKPIDMAADHQLRPEQNFISFHYIGLWYTSPGSVKYLYKLDGYDLEWKESRDMIASYSNLRPGTYTFYVKASENNFFLDEPVASYTLTILQPFWQRPWFILLALGASGGLLYGFVKNREARSERQASLKREMIESQLATLKAQINPHFLFNSFNTLITIIDENTENPRVAIEYVEKLSDFYRSILQYREHELISLEEEWELVQNYSYLLTKRYGANLRLHLDNPPAVGVIIPLTLQILVENAVKHNIISERRPLDIYISVDPDNYITVRNNLQPKSRAEPSTRFGLQSIVKRYQMLSEHKVHVDQHDHEFQVRIPIINRNPS